VTAATLLEKYEAMSARVVALELENRLLRQKLDQYIRHYFGGQRNAVIYTLLGSCRRHGVNPFDYLMDLFARLPAANITQIREFTPAAWAKAKAKEKVFAEAA